jgi:hypothetical protein
LPPGRTTTAGTAAVASGEREELFGSPNRVFGADDAEPSPPAF